VNKEQLEILSESLNVKPNVLDIWMPYFLKYLPREGINNPKRLLAFLAQIGQESGNFYYTEEIGNTNCVGYSGGCEYKGRGLIQLTHIGNYKKFRDKYGVDAVNNPSLIGGKYATTSSPEQLKNSLLASTFYWNGMGNVPSLNELADKLDLSKSVYDEPNNQVFKCIGRKINRGLYTDCTKPANDEATRLANFEKLRLAYLKNKPKFASVNKNNKSLLGISIITATLGLGLISFWYIKYAKK
jgi:putative chitinase